jgi:hypothetical protein
MIAIASFMVDVTIVIACTPIFHMRQRSVGSESREWKYRTSFTRQHGHSSDVANPLLSALTDPE